MSIPPTGRPPGTPSEGDKSEGPDRGKKPSKEFSLPPRKTGERESDDRGSFFGPDRRDPNSSDRRSAPRGTPDRRGGGGDDQQPSVQRRQQQQQQQGGGGGESQQQGSKETSAQKGAEGATKGEATALLSQAETVKIGHLIMKMVDSMQIGKLGGQDFASLNLKATEDIPIAFQGSNLTLSFEDKGLVIKFDNFMSAQQEQNAYKLVDNNKEQLAEMLRALEAKNIRVQSLNIGNNQVVLPSQQKEATPLSPPPPPQGEQPLQRDRDEGEGRQQQQGEEEGPEA